MLTDEQKRLFGIDGWTVVRGVVPGSMVAKARAEVARQLASNPRPEQRGPCLLFLQDPQPEPLSALLSGGVLAAAQELTAGTFEAPGHVQISVIVPPFRHRPGGPHVDGITPPEPDGRPGTFTLLAGVLLTDQSAEDMGNLWVWPGSHIAAAEYLRQQGPEALATAAPYPPVRLAQPRQVVGRAGDVLLAHYLLGHNIGGNTSAMVREAIYFRLHSVGHRERWRECVADPLLEFGPVRAAMGDGA